MLAFMRVVPVPCLKDNYAYLVICERTQKAAVVESKSAEFMTACQDRTHIDRVECAPIRPVPITTAQEVLLVDGFQYPRDR